MREMVLAVMVATFMIQCRIGRSFSRYRLSNNLCRPRPRKDDGVLDGSRRSTPWVSPRKEWANQPRQGPTRQLRSIPSKTLGTASGNDSVTETPSISLPNVVETTLMEEILPSCGIDTLLDETGRCCTVTMVLGVSGGCDSVALLHLMHDLLRNGDGSDKWNLVVAHFDHQQRGSASSGDRDFVVQLCDELHIPVHCYYWSDEVNGNHSDQQTTFSQDTARQWRRRTMRQLLYDTLCADASLTRCGLLLTAHHKDDSDETLLLKLLRGVHISNLSGLSVCAPDDSLDVSTDPQTCIGWARPFIHVRKSDIVHYLQQRQLAWREDASNQSDKYLRNRVRNELVPLLTDLVGDTEALSKRLENLSDQANDVRRYVHEQAQQSSTNDSFSLPLRFDLISKEVLYQWLTRHSDGRYFSYDQLQRIVRQVEAYPERRTWRLALGQGWNVCRHGDVLQLENVTSVPHETTTDRVSLTWRYLNDNESAALDEVAIHLSVVPLHSDWEFYHTNVGNGKLDFTPPWRRHHQPIRVTEFLRGQQVPLHLRKDTEVILLSRGNTHESVVAVYVTTKQTWIVDAAFVESHAQRVAIRVDV